MLKRVLLLLSLLAVSTPVWAAFDIAGNLTVSNNLSVANEIRCEKVTALNDLVSTDDTLCGDDLLVSGDISGSVMLTLSNSVSPTGTCYYLVIQNDGTIGKGKQYP